MSDVVISEPPLWMQADAYPARLDRRLIDAVWPTEGVIRGLTVSPRGAGANLSVDVAAGLGIVTGDDQANQGKYLVGLPTLTNVPTAAVPTGAGQKRRDLLVIKANDPDAGGPTGSNGVLRWVAGTATTGTPTVPAVPASALPLADVLLTDTTTSVAAGAITAQSGTAGAAAWTTLPLVNGWTAQAAPEMPARYRRVGDRVELTGTLTAGNWGAAITSALPVEYRPLHQVRMTTQAQSGGTFAFCQLVVFQTGVLQLFASQVLAGGTALLTGLAYPVT